MTPYTSFLVLESDADRERFKVKRRFRMRDGEKYFQEGRDNATFELVQKQMQRAGNWRLGLRRAALKRLAALGRDARLFQMPQPTSPMNGPYSGPIDIFSSWALPAGMAGGPGGLGGFVGYDIDTDGDSMATDGLRLVSLGDGSEGNEMPVAAAAAEPAEAKALAKESARLTNPSMRIRSPARPSPRSLRPTTVKKPDGRWPRIAWACASIRSAISWWTARSRSAIMSRFSTSAARLAISASPSVGRGLGYLSPAGTWVASGGTAGTIGIAPTT